MKSSLETIVTNNGELVLDAILTNGILKDIPVLSNLVGLLNFTNSVRDRIFYAKVKSFINEFEEMPPEDRENLKRKVLLDGSEGRRIGEMVVLVLEQSNHLDKSALIAKLLIAFGEKSIDDESLHRLSQAVNVAFFDDITDLLGPSIPDERCLKFLIASGLAERVDSPSGYGVSGRTTYRVSQLGSEFKNAIQKVSDMKASWHRMGKP